MSMVDWSLAPNWCNGYGLIGISKMPVWFDNFHYQYLHDGRKHEFYDACTFSFSALSETEDRPKQPQAWSGPEDGLPPVNTICEFRFRNSGSTTPWLEAEVRYLSDVTVVMRLDQHFDGHTEICRHPATVEFRNLNTAEQQATEKRESAIRELMDIAQVDCRVTAARLVDAGFKR